MFYQIHGAHFCLFGSRSASKGMLMDPGASPQPPGSPFLSSHYREFAFILVPRVVFPRTFRLTCQEPIGTSFLQQLCRRPGGHHVGGFTRGTKSISVQSEMPGAPKHLACYARSPRCRKARMCETGDFTTRRGLLFE